MQNPVLLDIKNLKTCFKTENGIATAVDGVNLQVKSGEIVGVVGESGCGKSVTSLSVMGLLPGRSAKITEGEILFNGQDLLKLTDKQMDKIRGDRISMIFQEPMTSLNPAMTCGAQVAEAFRLHQKISKKEALKKAEELFELTGISLPHQRLKEYPYQLSGGMRQRVMIAMALACDPQLLIADEPTTALDVTIQAQILELIRSISKQKNMAVLFISHDLGVIAELADKVAVMYAGRIVEEATVEKLFRSPAHPYTEGLLSVIPRLDENKKRLPTIDGRVPSLTEKRKGCSFADRCPYGIPLCREKEPELRAYEDMNTNACWKYREEYHAE